MLSKILLNVTMLILRLISIIQCNYYQFMSLIIINNLIYYYGWRLQIIYKIWKGICMQVVGIQTIIWPYAILAFMKHNE